jgi:hypothetical protein
VSVVSEMPVDIYTEPEPDPHTLANLGPLAALAGVWEGIGEDEHPVAEGTEVDAYVERIELQPIDAQTNGPQLLYGLRYHVHIVKPGEVEAFHDQVGYWLWEPATGAVLLSLAIPRGQVALASGTATADATTFSVAAHRGEPTNGIATNPWVDQHFRTTEFRMTVMVHPDDTWSYDQVTVLQIAGRDRPYEHRDRNTLHRLAAPTPNPTAQAAG